MKKQFDIGDTIEVIQMNSCSPKKKRKPYQGEITFMDMSNCIYGTWGDFVIDLSVDKVKKISLSHRSFLDFLKNI